MHTQGLDKPVGGETRIVRVGPELLTAAARRLIPQRSQEPAAATRRFLESARNHGIDLTLIWASVEYGGSGPTVRQALMAVPGAGRTAALFLSEPPPEGDPDLAAACRERARLLDHVCDWLAGNMAGRVNLAQMLPEPRDAWAPAALYAANFRFVGSLSYLRRPARLLEFERSIPVEPDWPEGIRVERFDRLPDRAAAEQDLMRALDRSYIDTLDCPELCGLRPTRDILESHRATGQWDPALWWIVYRGDEPEGCLLMARCPSTLSSELVYLGLSPALRGRGVGSRLLAMGLRAVCSSANAGIEIVCAVDRRNAPALRLYERAGFRAFSERVAFVRPL